MEPWYKVATPRREVREGRSFNPDQFAIALEQVVAGTAPEDYRDPAQFFARTCFTRALSEHAGMVLRRLSGKTDNAAPVLTLITQFGGGKTHTLTALYHLAKSGDEVASDPGVASLVQQAGVSSIPRADGGYERVWFEELVLSDEVAFEAGVFLLRRTAAESLKSGGAPAVPGTEARPGPEPLPGPVPRTDPEPGPGRVIPAATRTIRLVGTVPPEVWNRLGTRILPRREEG